MADRRDLRTGPNSLDDFRAPVDTIQRAVGYRVLPAEAPTPWAWPGSGQHQFELGRHVEIDDLSTLPSARGQRYAGELLTWVHGEAERLGCGPVHLDSGVGSERHTAPRLYLSAGYVINPHHHFMRFV